jgi:GntR family transcriptional regulator, rspAB operon transcriptional repressor
MSARRLKPSDQIAWTASSPPLERLVRTRGLLREQIYGMLRRKILTGEFAPGAVIDEKAIALKLGVSRTPVREAVKKLSDENLVEVRAQSATAITAIDRKLIHEAFLIRRALEVESIGIAAGRINARNEERLDELHLLHRRAIQHERYIDAIGCDDAFHRYISEISDLPRLWQAIEISKAQLDRCRFLAVPRPGHAEATLVEHRNIIGALIQKDEAASRCMMREHLDKSYHGIVLILDTIGRG